MYNYLTKLLMNKILIFEPGVSKIKVGKHEFIYDSKHDNVTTTNRNGLEMKKVGYLVPLTKNSKPNDQDIDALSVWIDAKHHTIYEITSYVYSGFVYEENSIFGAGELIP